MKVAPRANGRQSRLFDPPAVVSPPQHNGGHLPSTPTEPDLADDNFQARAVRQGRKAQELAWVVLAESGFCDIQERVSLDSGVEVNYSALDQRATDGCSTCRVLSALRHVPGFAARTRCGNQSGERPSCIRVGEGAAGAPDHRPPRPRTSAGQSALDAVTGAGKPIRAVIEMRDPEDLERLGRFAAATYRDGDDMFASSKPKSQCWHLHLAHGRVLMCELSFTTARSSAPESVS